MRRRTLLVLAVLPAALAFAPPSRAGAALLRPLGAGRAPARATTTARASGGASAVAPASDAGPPRRRFRVPTATNVTAGVKELALKWGVRCAEAVAAGQAAQAEKLARCLVACPRIAARGCARGVARTF